MSDLYNEISGNAIIDQILDSTETSEQQLDQLISIIEGEIGSDGISRQKEDQYFESKYGVTLSSILQYITSENEVLSEARNVIDRTEMHDLVFVPPDKTEVVLEGDSYEYKLEDRALIIVKELIKQGIDPENINIHKGITTYAMFRKEPYQLIEIKDIDKVILVCNEVGNSGFIVDISLRPLYN